MHRKSILLLLGAFTASVLLAASGCGGGDNESSGTTETRATRTDTTETTRTQTTRTETGEGTTPTSTSAASLLPAADCRKLSSLSARMGQAFNGRNPGVAAKAYAAFLQELADRAPEEIRDDFGVMADAYTKIAEALEETPPPGQTAKLQEVGKEIDQGALTRAANNINAWLPKHCAR